MRTRSAASRAVIGASITLLLGVAACPSARAQQAFTLAAASHAGERTGMLQTLAETTQASRPRLQLTKMESVGSSAFRGSLGVEYQLSVREQLAADAAFQGLLERLTQTGPRRNRLRRLAHSAARLRDAPNRLLCRLTGADRAHISWSKKRISFTWYVSFE